MRKWILGIILIVISMCTGCNAGNHNDPQAIKTTESTLGNIPTHYTTEEGNLTIDMQITAPKHKDLVHGTATIVPCNDVLNTIKSTVLNDNWKSFTSYDSTDDNGKAYTVYETQTGSSTAYPGKQFTISDMSIDYLDCEEDPDFLSKLLGSFQYDITFIDSPKAKECNVSEYQNINDFNFLSKEDAFVKCTDQLKAWGIQFHDLKYRYAFALDHNTMQQQYQKNQNKIKDDLGEDAMGPEYNWSEADDCYYYFARDTFQEEPVYYYNSISGTTSTPVELVYNRENGVVRVRTQRIFNYIEGDTPVQWLSFDTILNTIITKYTNLLTDAKYIIDDCEFRFYLKKTDSDSYETVPVWAFRVSEDYLDSNGSLLYITEDVLINAETAEEVSVE